MVSPSICGGFLSDKQSMIAFTWTISTVLTLFSFLVAIVLMIQIRAHYSRLERHYDSDDWYQSYYSNNYNYNDDGEEGGGGSQDRQQTYEEAQRVAESYIQLATTSAPSITFVGFYTVMLAIGLNLYGSTAIVGFMSLKGDYIAPCFSSSGMADNSMHVGVFGGAIVIFANLLVVCAVILGEVRVEDYRDNREREEEMEPYQVERIATVLAVLCIFLSALYTFFAVLLFLCYASDETPKLHTEEHHEHVGGVGHHHSQIPQPLVSVKAASEAASRHDTEGGGFIMMDHSSEGE